MTHALPTIRRKSVHNDILARLPAEWTLWPRDNSSVNQAVQDEDHPLPPRLAKKKLRFPTRPVVFISDAHADPHAFEDSLIGAGIIERKQNTEPDELRQFKLTKAGKKSEIVIGGDCLDKGPSNLELLRSIRHLYKLNARVTLIAGNHDLRLLMGLLALSRQKDIGNQHLFVRMGKKVVPLFREVFDQYLAGTKWEKGIPSEEECRRRIFPDADWFKEFPFHAAGFLTAEGIEREVHKMDKKCHNFERHCRSAGLSLRQIYAASLKCQQLFLRKKGEFHWFFKQMQLVAKRGSFLFLHAGLDDVMCHVLLKNGPRYANKAFHRNIQRRDLFSFYYSPIANTFRTKYRDADLPLTDRGVKAIHQAGIFVVVQGHVNRQQGQRLTLKQGLIHLEGDITLDRHSRAIEGLEGHGVGATLINKKVGIVGISCDYPTAKVMPPKQLPSLYAPIS